MDRVKEKKVYLPMKRAFDIVGALLACILLSPLLLLIILAVKLDSRGPILFRQKRLGRFESHFMILKFRSMRIDAPKDTPTHQLANPERYITKVGKFLRSTSLDELPQLLNILKGDMSFVGPRPALWNQDDLIAERNKYGANNLRPGLTGWAQIHGRDELLIPMKAKLDGYYVQNLSFLLDLKCFLATFASVFRRRGVVEGGTGPGASAELDETISAEKDGLERN